MSRPDPHSPRIAIACGGTGGHLFPGLAVAEALLDQGAEVTLVVSAKEVDQQALRGDPRFRILTVPAVGFSAGGAFRFLRGAWQSFRLARGEFRTAPPAAFLSMGGFTSAPPALAARTLGARVYLHEANAIPGRANRWLRRLATRGFVYFPEAAARLGLKDTRTLGMPVRPAFREPADPGASRLALGLAPDRPVLLVTGGSQGAEALNDAVLASAPALSARLPLLQYLHLTGVRDLARVREAYGRLGLRATVRAFLTEMEFALAAAEAAVARAGASSAAELAARRVPALLVPYPHATDGHQLANARALERDGAVRVLTQAELTPERLTEELVRLLTDEGLRARLRAGLATWDHPNAATELATDLLPSHHSRTPAIPELSSLPGQRPASRAANHASPA